MEATRYLERIRKIDSMLENRIEDYQRWLEVAEGLGGESLGDRVQTSRNLHRGADAIGQYIDIEKEIEALQLERLAIIRTIERLPQPEYDVTYRIYVAGQTLKELAYTFKKSYDTVKRWKNNALMLVQGMLDDGTAHTSTERG